MSQNTARISLAFSCVGHTYSHLMAPIFFVVALTLESKFNLSHGEIVSLIVFGNVLYGVGAPVAGWLADKWSAAGMMVLYYGGMGTGMVLTGLSDTPLQLALCLTLTGVFGSIYHPVGFAWLISQVKKRGTALGINGVFGTIGPSVAALSAGVLTDAFSWRAAFIVPGVLIFITGVIFYILIRRGIIHDRPTEGEVHHKPAKGEVMRVISVLSLTMLCTGLIYQSLSPTLPKLFSERLADLTGFSSSGEGVLGIGMLVAAVYIIAGAAQLIIGKLCDRYPLKWLYIGAFLTQIPFMILASQMGGLVLLVVVMVMVSGNQAALPIENTLVARYAPPDWRALAFGLKFILAFGVSGLGVLLEGKIYDLTGGFHWLFVVLACVATVGFAAGWLLPPEPNKPIAAK
ncbi:MAG: MFS transporter [Magnetovibrio sp.]|nr:MFS transporter [Magnetovibrio sp.]